MRRSNHSLAGWLLACLIFSSAGTAHAVQCVKDIFSAGASFDSFTYDVENRFAGKSFSVNSRFGLALRAAWVVFCPNSNIEINTYAKLRMFRIESSDTENELAGIRTDNILPSFGFEFRKVSLFGFRRLEIPLDIELREDLGVSNGPMGIYQSERISNLKVAAGLRYYFLINETQHLLGEIKLGPLLHLADEDDGGIFEVSAEYYRKLTEASSAQVRIYYEELDMMSRGNDIIGKNGGVRASLVFRY